jgi:predicted HTH transcriptional regulator
MCSPNNIKPCEDEMKAEIQKFSSMSDNNLATSITEQKEKMMEDAKETFKISVAALQENFQLLSNKKDKTLEKIKNSSVGLMKAVKASKATTKGRNEL